jgi:hypothetical protein
MVVNLDRPKIYVAGKYSSILEVRSVMDKLKYSGFDISYDWTKKAEENSKNPNSDRNIDSLMDDARRDIEGVLVADWTIILMTDPEYIYRGSFCELGASIARDIQRGLSRTIIIGVSESYASTCCFYFHPRIIHVKNIESAIYYITTGKSPL